MKIGAAGFRGMALLAAPERLEDSQATVLSNARVESGDLVAFRSELLEQDTGRTATGTHSIFRHVCRVSPWVASTAYALGSVVNYYSPVSHSWGVYVCLVANTGNAPINGAYWSLTTVAQWLRFDEAVRVCRAPLAGDVFQRVYWTLQAGGLRAADKYMLGLDAGYVPRRSRRAGLPMPEGAPSFGWQQVGFGIVSRVVLCSGNGTNGALDALVLMGAEHDGSLATRPDSGAMVALDYPGIDTAAYQVEIPGSWYSGAANLRQFRLKGLQLRQVTWGSITKPKNVKGVPQKTIVKAVDHQFSTGDLVAIHRNEANPSTNLIKVYKDVLVEIEVLDPDRFALVGTDASGDGSEHVWNDGNSTMRKVARIVAAANPVQLWQVSGVNQVFWQDTHYLVWTTGLNWVDGGYSGDSTWSDTTQAAQLQDRAYLTTWVNGWGEEGPPSAPSATGPVMPGALVTVQRNAELTTTAHGTTETVTDFWLYNVVAWRLYRLDVAGSWRLVGEYAVTVDSASEQMLDAALGESLLTTGWLEPPSDLQGLTAMPGGILLGFTGKTVCASVPYQPGAWPLAQRVSVDYPVMGLLVTAAGVVVLTTGYPALIVGTDPATFEVVKLELPEPCVAGRSLVDMGDWGLYASPEGLVQVSQNTGRVLTRELGIMNRLQWQTLVNDPATVVGGFFEGRYFASYQAADGTRKGLVLDPAAGELTGFELAAMALYADVSEGTLYALRPDGVIVAVDRDPSNWKPLVWESKRWQLSAPVSFAAMQVLSGASVAEPLTVTLYAWDLTTGLRTVVHTQTVTGNWAFRVPPTNARQWQIRVERAAASSNRLRVSGVWLATSMREFKNG